MANIILLKAPSTPDPYEQSLKSLGYHVFSVPILETVLTNLEQLKSILVNEPSYGRVIITSARASEAWKNVVEDLLSDTSSTTSIEADWCCLPFYVVGDTTATLLRSLRDTHGDSCLVPKDIRGKCGTSERLARFILEDVSTTEGGSRLNPKSLYLTGDKNRDTIPNILNDGGLEVECLKVYETHPSSNLARDLECVVASSPRAFDDWWIVFFAPSAASFAIPILRGFFDLPTLDLSSDRARSPHKVRIAAIGPTTSASLREGLGIHVDVVATNPTPDDMVSAIANHDRKEKD